MLAAVKFFLGQDEAADNSDEESDEDTMKAVNPSKAEIYNASKKAGLSPICRTVHGIASDDTADSGPAGQTIRLRSARHNVQCQYPRPSGHDTWTWEPCRCSVKRGVVQLPQAALRQCSCCMCSGGHGAVQGTASSKRKKMAKLKRVMAQVKKQDRRKRRDTDQNFAAIQLLQDPQVDFGPLRPV